MAQFGKLDVWVQTHATELHQILTPGRHVLYGEWLAAKHSIRYTKLPDLFLAFDIFDKGPGEGEECKQGGQTAGRFLSVAELAAKLEKTTIHMVPTLAEQVFESKEELLALLETPSAFCSGAFVEGVYLRMEDEEGGGLFSRAKLVRPDFVQNIDTHWSKLQLVKNIVRY
jgi:hypothetical protein